MPLHNDICLTHKVCTHAYLFPIWTMEEEKVRDEDEEDVRGGEAWTRRMLGGCGGSNFSPGDRNRVQTDLA